MINFCVEPKKPCRKNPIGELDFKIDKCYSSIYSRLCCHENDSVSHISQEERDEWNGKASNSALLDLQNQLNEITGEGDNSIKKEILIEVSRQIAGAITDLNIEEYAKKKYVDDAISNIDFDQYVTKENADSTYLNKADYIKFDPTNYYTIAQIQKIIEDSTIGKDYPIESFTLEYNELILTQKNGGQFRVALSESRSGGGVDTDYVQQQLLNYIKKNTLSKLIINDKAYSIESGRDIKIPTSSAGPNIDYNKFGYNKSYFKEQQSNSAAPSKPSANKPPQDGSGWMETPPNYRPGYYIWMTQVFINGNGQYGEYTNPICLTGTAGENAVSYDIKTSTSTINYQDGTMYPDIISVYVVKSDGSQITNITPSNSSNLSFSYSINGGNTWTAISSDQIQTEGDNGMLFKATNGTITLTEYVPIIGQTFKGSPLRIIGAWTSGKKYYDGKRDAENGIFYQDVVLYENMYYVCVNTDSGESDHWATTPDVATYFQKFAVTENFVTDKIIANQAYVKELSSEEVVIMDGDAIVAGMTSSKDPDSKSDLNGKVRNKGDVRIWAGEIYNADLTTAPFTVTNTGNLTAHTATLYDATFDNPNGDTCITTKEQTIYTSPDTKVKAVSSGMFINDTTGNNVAQLYYLSESQSGSHAQSGLRISTNSKTKFFSNVKDDRAQLYIGAGIKKGPSIGGTSLAYFSTYVQEGDLAVEFVSEGKCGIRIVGLPKYPNLSSAYSDNNLNEGDMFLVSDNTTDNMNNTYEDHVVHIKGRRVS